MLKDEMNGEMHDEENFEHSSRPHRHYVIDRETSKKHKRKKGKINKVGMTVILTTCGVVLVALISFISYYMAYVQAPDQSSVSLGQVMSSYSDTLLIDEALTTEKYSDLASTMQTLEQAISLKHELEGLELDKYNKGLDSVDVSALSLDELNALITEYKDSKDKVDLNTPTKATTRFYTVVGTLTSYFNSLSSDVYINSADALVRYAELLVKSSVANSLDLSLDQMNQMQTSLATNPNFSVCYTDEAGRDYKMTLSFCNSIKSLHKEVGKLYSLTHPKANEQGVTPKVDADAVLAQEEVVLNHIKDIMQYTYYVEDGVIHQNGNQFRKVKSTK